MQRSRIKILILGTVERLHHNFNVLDRAHSTMADVAHRMRATCIESLLAPCRRREGISVRC